MVFCSFRYDDGSREWGVDKSRVQRPDSTFRAAHKGQGQCAICQEEMPPLAEAPLGFLVELPCGHAFHSSCISSCSKKWASICVLCKKRFSPCTVQHQQS